MDEKKDDENIREVLYIGNLWRYRKLGPNASEESRRCKHSWVMFLSTNPVDIIPPKTVKSVEYQLHPTYVVDRITLNKSPFILRRSAWGTFNIGVKISFKNSRGTIFTRYPLQFRWPLRSMSLTDEQQFYKKPDAKFDEIMKRFDQNSVSSIDSFVKKTGLELRRHLLKLPAPIVLTDFNQTPETVVEIIRLFFRAYSLKMPEEILQLLVAYSSPYLMRLNSHQSLVLNHCHDISVRLRNKGKQVLLQNCKNLKLEVEDLINFVEMFHCEKVDVTVIGEIGVHTFKLEQSSDVTMRFRDDSSMITFIDQYSKGLIQAAPYPKGDELLEFKDLKYSFRFPEKSSRTKWSQTHGWQNTILTNAMRAALS